MPEHSARTEQETKPGINGLDDKNTIGEQLRRARKTKSISLMEVSEHTKISKRHLEALEKAEYEILPGETYTKGFLRAYAKYLD